MNSKILLFSALTIGSLTFQSCDEDNDQIIDVELNDEQLIVTSNTSSQITKVQTGQLTDTDPKFISVPFADADGAAVRGDDAYVMDRTNGKLTYLKDVFDNDNEVSALVESTSDETIINGRGIAVGKETFSSNVAVAQDASPDNGNVNKIFLFRTVNNNILLKAEVTVPINLWGLEWNQDDLYAVVDNSDSLAVFENFDEVTGGTVEPTYYLKIEGIGRTHGITYGSDDDILILTDIGDAASDSDGGFVFVSNWNSTLNDVKGTGVLPMSIQRRVYGAATFLGNPVDVAYDDDNNRIFIAERARDGGKIFGYDVPSASGSFAPVYSLDVPGCSSVDYRD